MSQIIENGDTRSIEIMEEVGVPNRRPRQQRKGYTVAPCRKALRAHTRGALSGVHGAAAAAAAAAAALRRICSHAAERREFPCYTLVAAGWHAARCVLRCSASESRARRRARSPAAAPRGRYRDSVRLTGPTGHSVCR
eukprot:SAG31_NODE_5611_length_2424_cov_1.667527_1_plen_138_part_00